MFPKFGNGFTRATTILHKVLLSLVQKQFRNKQMNYVSRDESCLYFCNWSIKMARIIWLGSTTVESICKYLTEVRSSSFLSVCKSRTKKTLSLVHHIRVFKLHNWYRSHGNVKWHVANGSVNHSNSQETVCQMRNKAKVISADLLNFVCD